MGLYCAKTFQHTNPHGETYIFGSFRDARHPRGHANSRSTVSTLLYLDPHLGWVPADSGAVGEALKDEGGDEEDLKDVYFLSGAPRVEQLKKLIKPRSDGVYHIPYTNIGYGETFANRVNYTYFTEQYPWLDSCKIDSDVEGGLEEFCREDFYFTFCFFVFSSSWLS